MCQHEVLCVLDGCNGWASVSQIHSLLSKNGFVIGMPNLHRSVRKLFLSGFLDRIIVRSPFVVFVYRRRTL